MDNIVIIKPVLCTVIGCIGSVISKAFDGALGGYVCGVYIKEVN